MSTELFLEARQLVLRAFPSVDAQDFCLHSGEHMLLIGEEGSGKTSLVKTLIGMLSPASGSLRLFGEDVSALSPRRMLAQRRKLGMVFANDGLFPAWSGYDNLALPLRYHATFSEDEIAAHIRHLQTEYRIPQAWLDSNCSALPREHRAVLSIARALLPTPRLLIIDGVPLDLVLGYAGHRGFDLIRDFTKSGGTLLLCLQAAHAEQLPETAMGVDFLQARLEHGRLQCDASVPP